MKITFLGTGAFGNTKRVNQGILFEVLRQNQDKDISFLIDTCGGAEIIRQFNKLNLDKSLPKNVFLTHVHPDHCFGLPFLLFKLRDQISKDNRFNIYGSKVTLKNIKKIINLSGMGFLLDYCKDRVNWQNLSPFNEIELTKNISVMPFKVTGRKDPKMDDFGYVVEFKNKKIVVSGDTPPCKELEKQAKGADVLICECFSTHDKKKITHAYGHSTAKDVGIIGAKAGVKKIVLTHIHEDYNDLGDKLVDEVKKYFKAEVVVAKDLSSIEV